MLVCFLQEVDAQIIKSVSRVSVDSGGKGLRGKNINPNINEDGSVIAFTSFTSKLERNSSKRIEKPLVRFLNSGITQSIAVNSDGEPANDGRGDNSGNINFSSSKPSLNSDGTLVAFVSDASNLVSSDNNNFPDVYLRNFSENSTLRINVNDVNQEATRGGFASQISANGKFVIFSSFSPNLSQDDTDEDQDVFVTNLESGEIEALPHPGFENGDGKLSGDGRYAVYGVCYSLKNCVADVSSPFLYDRATKSLTELTPGFTEVSHQISDDGNFVVIQSRQAVNSPDTPAKKVGAQLHLYDVKQRTLSLISINGNSEIASASTGLPDISGDGRFITFFSAASDLVDNDTNKQEDIFMLDRDTGKVLRLNLTSSCKEVKKSEEKGIRLSQPVISANGKFVAFSTFDRLTTRPLEINGFSQKADTDRAADVYVVEVDFDSEIPKFNPQSTAASPFLALDCSGEILKLTFPDLKTDAQVFGRANSDNSLTRIVEIRRLGSKGQKSDIRRLRTKSNEIVIKNLKPGNFEVAYRNEVTTNNQTSMDNFSSLKSFTIVEN